MRQRDVTSKAKVHRAQTVQIQLLQTIPIETENLTEMHTIRVTKQIQIHTSKLYYINNSDKPHSQNIGMHKWPTRHIGLRASTAFLTAFYPSTVSS